ncbi:hypothetical protein HK102_006459, partial [Quaeritorhiza haematococci]
MAKKRKKGGKGVGTRTDSPTTAGKEQDVHGGPVNQSGDKGLGGSLDEVGQSDPMAVDLDAAVDEQLTVDDERRDDAVDKETAQSKRSKSGKSTTHITVSKSPWFYFRLQIIFEDPSYSIGELFFKEAIHAALRELYGAAAGGGAALQTDLLRFEEGPPHAGI